MSFITAKPSSVLSPYIQQYWTLESDCSTLNDRMQRLVPSGLMEVGFYFNERPVMQKKYKKIHYETAMISGQQTTYDDILLSGKVSLFAITLKPAGAMFMFDAPALEFKNEYVSLNLVQKDWMDGIEHKLFEVKGFVERIKIVEKLLEQLLQKKEPKFADRVRDSISVIDTLKANTTVDYLANRACLSRKQFERSFSATIGLSPKQFLKVIRFQQAIYQKQINAKKPLTRLAYDCGYYDQSHMINDFKALSGVSPSDFFSSNDAYSDYFS